MQIILEISVIKGLRAWYFLIGFKAYSEKYGRILDEYLELSVLVVYAADHPDEFVEGVERRSGSSEIGRSEAIIQVFHWQQLLQGQRAVWWKHILPWQVSNFHVYEQETHGRVYEELRNKFREVDLKKVLNHYED